MARRRRTRQKKQRNQAILNFVLAGLAVAIIGFAFFALQPEPYDELTLCEISDDLPPHTAVIIDKTDEYNEQQAGLIAAIIRRTRDRLEIGERLTLFELDEAANRIREEVDPDANIIVGSTLDQGMGGTMRVSVVATGIDASGVKTEIPVPRRSMSAPLQPQAEVEEEQAPVAAAKKVAPAAAASQAYEDEGDQAPLFEDLDAQRAVAEERVEDMFAERAQQQATPADDLPPPAYQPQVTAFEPRRDEESIEAEPEAFVAPRAPAPGTPSPEALARLRAAAQKASPQQQAPAMAAALCSVSGML